jgi:hypothetical protein
VVSDIEVDCSGKGTGVNCRVLTPATVAQPTLQSGYQGVVMMWSVFPDKMEMNILPVWIIR